MKRQLYFKCSSDHLFSGKYCPSDGWTHKDFGAVIEIAKQLDAKGETLSHENLLKHNAPPAGVRRAVFIDFGSEVSRFDMIAVREYFRHGVRRPATP